MNKSHYWSVPGHMFLQILLLRRHNCSRSIYKAIIGFQINFKIQLHSSDLRVAFGIIATVVGRAWCICCQQKAATEAFQKSQGSTGSKLFVA